MTTHTTYFFQKYWTKGLKYAKSHTKKRWHGKRVKSFDLAARGPGGRKIASMAKTWFWLVVLTDFLKGVSFTRRLLVCWVSLEFWHHSLLIHIASCHLLKITLDKRCLNLCPDHTFFEHWMRKRGKLSSLCCTMHHRASTESYYAARQKKRSRWKKSWVDCFAWVVVGGFSAPNLAA